MCRRVSKTPPDILMQNPGEAGPCSTPARCRPTILYRPAHHRQEPAMSALTDDPPPLRHYIRSERGLADTTLLAYPRDLDRFARWADNGGLDDYLTPTLRQLAGYLSHLREDEELAPSSVARHLVALKVFYRFLR